MFEKLESYIKEKQEKKGLAYSPIEWLDSAAKRAEKINLGTHMIKYINGSAKGAKGLIAEGNREDLPSFKGISTNSLANPIRDFDGNAAFFDVAGFLLVEKDGVTLLDKILKNDFSPLAKFTDSLERVSFWGNGLKKVKSQEDPESHTLAKQVYFPLGGGEYHLLAPVFSSSLQQAIYDRISHDRYSEESKAARLAKKNSAYSDNASVFYPNLAIQSFGGANHQNISYLNSISRRGSAYLLNCKPPTWQSTNIKNFKHKNAFWRALEWNTKENVAELKAFLVANWNVYNFDIKLERKNRVSEIIETFIVLIHEVRQWKPGWSKASTIPQHEKLCLDSMRDDEEFQLKRLSEDWRKEMAKAFGRWFNNIMKNKEFTFEEAEYKEWLSECKEYLKELD